MRIVLLFLVSFLIIPSLQAAPGDPDTSFDVDGLVTADFFGEIDFACDLAIQPDGRILAAGEADHPSTYDVALARYLPDGSPDSSFDGDGKLTLPVGTIGALALGVALQPDGKIVIAGTVDTAGGNDALVARFLPDGSPDTTFDGDGIFTATPATNSDLSDVALQPDGKIVAAGRAGTDILVMRLNADGSPDAAFDGDGVVITPIGSGNDNANAVALQKDGKILAAGSSVGANEDFALVRYDSDGKLDTSFGGGDGIVTTPIGSGLDRATSMVVLPDGRIVLHGFSGPGNLFALARYNPDGTPDVSFDGDGKILIPLSSGVDEGSGLAVQADGKILAFGNADVGGGNKDLFLVRLNPNGSLDAGFGGGDGIVSMDAGTVQDGTGAIALQPDGKIVGVGFNANDLVVVRFEGDSGDVSIVKSADAATAEVGDPVTYTLTVKNNGSSAIGGVTVTDALDSKLTLQSATPAAGTCSGTATVVCDLGTMAAGAQADVTLVVRPNAAGTIANQATVTAQAVDSNPADNTSAPVSLTVTVPPGGTTTGGAGGDGGGCSLIR
ncbi:MAG TPA: calcium-binding protein [bacterium]|nr:calcium-binding protein [bacterium]